MVEKIKMKLTEELFLINNYRNRLKRFLKYVNNINEENNYMEIDFGYILSISTKPVWKCTQIESIEDGLKEYEEMLKEGWKKTNLYKRNF